MYVHHIVRFNHSRTAFASAIGAQKPPRDRLETALTLKASGLFPLRRQSEQANLSRLELARCISRSSHGAGHVAAQ